MKCKLKILFVLIFVIFSTSRIGAASGDNTDVDSLLSLAEKAIKSKDPVQTIFWGKKALLYSERIRYKEGIVKSNFFIANGLCNIGNYSESLIYINKLVKDYNNYIAENLDFRFKLTNLTGRNYLALGFRKQAIAEFKKEFIIADLKTDYDEKLKTLVLANVQLSACYENYKPDSTIYYLNKAKAIHQIYPKIDATNIYLSLIDYHLRVTKRLDSALYYNELILKGSEADFSDVIFQVWERKAEILYNQKKYKESLEYGFKVLARAKSKRKIEDRIFIYKLLADNYRALKKNEDELFYVNKYVSIKDSLTKASVAGIQISADIISDEATSSKNKNLNLKLLLGVLILTVITLFFIYRIRRIKKKKNSIIGLKEIQINELQDTRLDKAKEELIILAKKDAPEFTMKFKEVYPELNEKLLQIQPNLVNTEIAFCGYLKLNFTTKEIATYIGVTPRAVQIRKNRIRKKLNIPSDEDIYKWIDGL